MNNPLLSSLIYRLIGQPGRWQQDHLTTMAQLVSETDSLDQPYALQELASGEMIIGQMQQSKRALCAFNVLFDHSRFQLVILDEHLTPIHHNKNAQQLFHKLCISGSDNKIKAHLVRSIQNCTSFAGNENSAELVALNPNENQYIRLYYKPIQNFHLLVANSQRHENTPLSASLVADYKFTYKEQRVLQFLIQGNSINQISDKCFVTHNTVRTHLKAIFRKTDTHSQAGVIGLVLNHEAQILDGYFNYQSSGPAISTRSQDKELYTSSGEKIVYREYGSASARPLIVFHSSFGCRLSVVPNIEQICERTDRRIIIPDRPGFGKTASNFDHPKNWNKQLQEFIECLAIKDYDILGHVLGCQLAVKFAASKPSGLGKVILCSPIVINKMSVCKDLAGILNPTARLVCASPRFAKEIYALWLKSLQVNLADSYHKLIEESSTATEFSKLKQLGGLEILISSFRESVAQGVEGATKEMPFCLSPLKLPSTELDFPVEFWCGDQDQRISLDGVKNIAKDFPNHRLHIREDCSEYIYYSLFEQIIA